MVEVYFSNTYAKIGTKQHVTALYRYLGQKDVGGELEKIKKKKRVSFSNHGYPAQHAPFTVSTVYTAVLYIIYKLFHYKFKPDIWVAAEK